MFEFETLIGLMLSLALGALVGTEREIRQQKTKQQDFAGFRTFTLISLFGFLIGLVGKHFIHETNVFVISLFGIFLLCAVAYRAVNKLRPTEVSVTSEVSALLTFIIGFFVSQGEFHLSISLAILITLVLFLGNALHKFAKKIKSREVFATLKFALISLVILPLLPQTNYALTDLPFLGEVLTTQNFIPASLLQETNVFNFHTIWLMVVLISGIAYVGFLLLKIFGEKGILLTGFLGGLMSSTALTSSFSIESKHLKHLSSPLAVGVIIACSTMFFRIIVEVLLLNSSLLDGLALFLFFIGFLGCLCAGYLFLRTKLNHVKTLTLDSPFSLKPALKFGFFFIIVLFVSKFFSLILGDKGVFVVALFSGFADVDAITISLCKLAFEGAITPGTAKLGIVFAAFSNTLFKAGVAYYLGSASFGKIILFVFGALLLAGAFFAPFLLF